MLNLKEPILKLSRSQKMKGFVTHNRLGRSMARRFVAGESLNEALQTTQEMNQAGLHVSLDHLGENTTNLEEARQATEDVLAMLTSITQEKLDANVSVKLTSLGQDVDEAKCFQNISQIVQKAQELGDIFVRLDMEGSAYTQRTLDMFKQLWEAGAA